MTNVHVTTVGATPAYGSPPSTYVAIGRDIGIREGERRMLWAIAVGAEWDRARPAAIWEGEEGAIRRATAAYTACRNALRALHVRGDEDASRVLGERGW